MMILMERVCAYCNKSLGIKEPKENKDVSHGICPECYLVAIGRLTDLSISGYLDFFDQPMIAVDNSNRVMAYNRQFLKGILLGNEKLKELSCGEFIECRNSKHTWECGKSSQCNDCPLRQLIRRTFQTSQPQERIQIDLTHLSEDRFFKRSWTVSVAKVKEMVHLTFLEPAQTR